jgi:hypothetical protein
LLVRYLNIPRLKRFHCVSRRGAPPGRQPPFGERDVVCGDASWSSRLTLAPIRTITACAFASSRISHPLGHRLPLRVGFRLGQPRRDRSGLLSSTDLSMMSDLGSPFPPAAAGGVSDRFCSVPTGRIPFGPSFVCRGSLRGCEKIAWRKLPACGLGSASWKLTPLLTPRTNVLFAERTTTLTVFGTFRLSCTDEV